MESHATSVALSGFSFVFKNTKYYIILGVYIENASVHSLALRLVPHDNFTFCLCYGYLVMDSKLYL
jgi:hypothetical protein